MKKQFLTAFTAAALAMTTLLGSSVFASQEAEEITSGTAEAAADDTVIRLAGLKGPTTIGMVGLLDNVANGIAQVDCEFTLAGAADEISPLLIKGDLDIAAIPLNLASVLYNKTEGGIELLAVNTLGVLYICENGEPTVTDWSDLKGKTIIATGKGSTPEYALRYLLSENGLDPDTDVTMDWKSEPSETVAAMAATEENTIAMIPQPYVIAAKGQLDNLNVVLDLTESWDALDNGSRLLTAGLVVRTAFAEEHPDLVEAFLEDYAASTEYVNSNPADAALIVESYDIAKAAVAEKAIPQCNIVCITGDEMNEIVPGYLEVLFNANPESVGGALPGDDFYY